MLFVNAASSLSSINVYNALNKQVYKACAKMISIKNYPLILNLKGNGVFLLNRL